MGVRQPAIGGNPRPTEHFATPLTITIESDRPRPIEDQTSGFDAVHALLNIAHRRAVKSFGGSAKIGNESQWCGFWETASWLSRQLGSSRARSSACSRATCTTHPFHETDPRGQAAVSRDRDGIVDLCAPANPDWTQKVNGEHLPMALTWKVDRSGDAWVRDPDKWLESSDMRTRA